ncbi:hypothetical protein SEA_GLEXAN_148 [Mycobacterium phage Glexan]|nr:hypothetical protein SEA_GLEXAN_148 [Mycobacterium phage Glexan]
MDVVREPHPVLILLDVHHVQLAFFEALVNVALVLPVGLRPIIVGNEDHVRSGRVMRVAAHASNHTPLVTPCRGPATRPSSRETTERP